MQRPSFQELFAAQGAARKFVSVGLDFDEKRVPAVISAVTTDISFLIHRSLTPIIDATKDVVCAYKPNLAFYARYGAPGMAALRSLFVYIHTVAPEVLAVLDFKVGDIIKTNLGYVEEAFGYFNADAVTVSPYLGGEALIPFLDCGDKGIFVLCRTSNPRAGEFQDLVVHAEDGFDAGPLYVRVANRVAHRWNQKGNCALVAGATYPDQLAKVRKA